MPAELLGVAPPPLVPFDAAELSPMARSFYDDNKRVSNRRIKDELGVRLRYPSYQGRSQGAARSSSVATVCVSSARSLSVDSRWSPSLTSVTATSRPVRRSASARLVCHGTSGSPMPCSSRTGLAIGDGGRA